MKLSAKHERVVQIVTAVLLIPVLGSTIAGNEHL